MRPRVLRQNSIPLRVDIPIDQKKVCHGQAELETAEPTTHKIAELIVEPASGWTEVLRSTGQPQGRPPVRVSAEPDPESLWLVEPTVRAFTWRCSGSVHSDRVADYFFCNDAISDS